MTLRITGRQRTLALKFKDLPRDLRHTISVALVDGNHLVLDLCPQELEALAHAAAQALHRTRNPKSQRAITTLMRKISHSRGNSPNS